MTKPKGGFMENAHGPTTVKFLRYVGVSSQSNEETDARPTSPGQVELAKMVEGELRDLVARTNTPATVTLHENGKLITKIPATPGHEEAVVVYLGAHFDTYPNGSPDVNPILTKYEGGDIVLPNGEYVITAKELAGFEGKTIITSDGTSVLGADDKAGMAEIMQCVEVILEKEIPHGPIVIVFFPDEELGYFDVENLPEDMQTRKSVFVTADGGALNEIDVGCYSGRQVIITFKGIDAHPGPGGDKIVSAIYVANEFISMLAKRPSPWNKDRGKGYQFALKIVGSTDNCTVTCIPRAFVDAESLEKVEELKRLARIATEIYPGSSCKIEVVHQYTSTKDAIDANPWSIKPIVDALEKRGMTPRLEEVPGGTDGAMLNLHYPNVPAPNGGTGARNIHEFTEWVSAEDLETGSEILVDAVIGYRDM